jgi:hypothetical protein
MHYPLHPKLTLPCARCNDNRVRCAALNSDASQKARQHRGPN